MTATLPLFLTESESVILIFPLRTFPLISVQEVPKSITMVLGKPDNGVIVTVAHGIKQVRLEQNHRQYPVHQQPA